MKKRGQGDIIIIILIVLAIIFTAVIIWTQIISPRDSRESDINKSGLLGSSSNVNTSGINGSQNSSSFVNETNPVNDTGINNSNNSTQINETDIPDPSGKITAIDRRNNDSEYFCNYNETAVHQVRIYTYRIMDGIKNLSKNYIESKKLDKICSSYGNLSGGMNYNIEWLWDSVAGIDGYKVYQYYNYGNFSRNFDYYIDIKTNRILDTDPDLWKK